MRYPLNYTLTALPVLQAINDGKVCSVERLQTAIVMGNLPILLAQDQIDIDPSLLADGVIVQKITNLAGADRDHKLLHGINNGYTLLLAYLIELIQRDAPHG